MNYRSVSLSKLEFPPQCPCLQALWLLQIVPTALLTISSQNKERQTDSHAAVPSKGSSTTPRIIHPKHAYSSIHRATVVVVVVVRREWDSGEQSRLLWGRCYCKRIALLELRILRCRLKLFWLPGRCASTPSQPPSPSHHHHITSNTTFSPPNSSSGAKTSVVAVTVVSGLSAILKFLEEIGRFAGLNWGAWRAWGFGGGRRGGKEF